MSKVDHFASLVEGRTVLKPQKLGKTGQVIAWGLLIAGVSGVVWYRYIRTPKFRVINYDAKTNRVQIESDVKRQARYLDGGKSVNLGKITVSSQLIKQPDSDLIAGITLTARKGSEITQTKTITY